MDAMSLMREDLALAGFAPGTRRAYLASTAELARFLRRDPALAVQADVRRWVRNLQRRGLGGSTLRREFAALRFLFRKTLGRPDRVSFLSWPRDTVRALDPPSRGEVEAVLKAADRTVRPVLALLYATGMRLSEALDLQPEDLDRERRLIRVRAGKGNRERFVPLPGFVLERSRLASILPIRSPEAVRAALRRACDRSGTRALTPHSFRHAFASHQLAAGVDLRLLQVTLGHASIRSTARYARPSPAAIARIPCLLRSLRGVGGLATVGPGRRGLGADGARLGAAIS